MFLQFQISPEAKIEELISGFDALRDWINLLHPDQHTPVFLFKEAINVKEKKTCKCQEEHLILVFHNQQADL